MTSVGDRAVGALLGVHVGDALGATVEFSPAEEIARRFPDGHRDIIGGGPFGWRAGAPTDDTDLTVALCRAYLEADSSDDVVAAAGEHMLRWLRSGPVDIGATTSAALEAFARHRDPRRSGGTGDGSQANGSLMRTMPVAVARHDDPERRRAEADRLSAITHAHPVCRSACVVYCDIAAELLAGASPGAAVAGGLEAPLQAAVAQAIEDASTAESLAALAGPRGGYVLWSLRIAIQSLMHASEFEEALVEVVATGGDTDTNGAIAGGLLGAHFGVDAIPERWLATLELRDELTAAARQLVDLRRRVQ